MRAAWPGCHWPAVRSSQPTSLGLEVPCGWHSVVADHPTGDPTMLKMMMLLLLLPMTRSLRMPARRLTPNFLNY
ncbi:uncharacterized protein BO80DRAFT_22266 [Aspergillus ibericus CBS 121593]|uniref:Uncharacterized protein n=1 Tax=Aspergillus ibericus CBS 121593 TaxID=1448316 RepID=A0A395H5J9_9EURO|nr:hypothetical protein BO80DRAFT_22266 [Aspergillus ibericus CBS 121593]RAL02956.1 hypothetical protein BO80DRAFT_22266 [Aspergillus ibericus CBS 121593]